MIICFYYLETNIIIVIVIIFIVYAVAQMILPTSGRLQQEPRKGILIFSYI